MLKNFIKIALRNILKHKGFSFINIVGLAVGIASSILILLFVSYELGYDKFHEKSDRIYRLAVRARVGDTPINQTFSSAITFRKLLEDFPEIENGVKISGNDRTPVILEDKTFYETGILEVDSTFFEIFSIPMIHGEPDHALSQPNTMVITRSTAMKYFGKSDAIGEVLQIGYSSGTRRFEITGVCEDVPAQSHFHFDFLVSLVSFPDFIGNTGWTANNFISYLLLKEGTSKALLEEKLKEFTRKYMGGDSFDAWVAKGNFWEYYLQPIESIHLESQLNGEFEPNGNKTYVYIFFIISVFIMVIACINFMNLATAKSSVRAREVGMRKVLGAGRRNLIFQFLSESIILSLMACVIALGIVHLVLPAYGNFVSRPLEIDYTGEPLLIPVFIGFGLVVGIFAGSYPAFHLSSFKSLKALRGNSFSSKSGSSLRTILVVFQFSISIFLIVGTLIVYQQLEYFQNKDLGFDKEQVLVLSNPGAIDNNLQAFKDELRTHSSILQVSGSNMLPGTSFSNIGFGAEGVEAYTLNIGICDYDFADLLKLELVSGRFFSREMATDFNAVVLNEKAVELLGWEDPIGKKINNWGNNRGEFNIIGVMKDFHYESMHQEIRPMGLFLEGGYYKRVQSYIPVRLNTSNISETIAYIEGVWSEFAPKKPFEYTFLDKDFEALFQNERQTRQIFTIFSILAIFIACLGLAGLSSFTAERRTKEIGIRKVFGSSVSQIMGLINKQFLKWIAISILIAWPLTWYLMSGWLENFAYRIQLQWWMFVIPAFMAIIISSVVVSALTVRVAYKNPIESLRYE